MLDSGISEFGPKLEHRVYILVEKYKHILDFKRLLTEQLPLQDSGDIIMLQKHIITYFLSRRAHKIYNQMHKVYACGTPVQLSLHKLTTSTKFPVKCQQLQIQKSKPMQSKHLTSQSWNHHHINHAKSSESKNK
jgi:hypothetical protein